jgi:hypothetical protein
VSTSLQAIEEWHPDIDDHYVWLKRWCRLQKGKAIATSSHHVIARFQKFPEGFQDEPVIIGEHNTR